MRKKIIVVIAQLLCIPAAMSDDAQRYAVRDGDTIQVKISANELTRFVIEGGGRLSKIWGVEGAFEVKPDKENGEVSIVPVPGGPSAVSFFLRDDLGNVYTVVAQQYDIPSQTIVLKPRLSAKSIAAQGGDGLATEPYLKNIKELMRALALNTALQGYDHEDVNQDIRLWKEARITYTHRLIGLKYIGDAYLLTNVSKEEMRLDESEFLSLGERVKAVAIDRKTLLPNETTTVYVIRGVDL